MSEDKQQNRRKTMKIKDGCVAETSDFWYDLTYGGYLKPEEILDDPADVKRVNEAISILSELESLCEEM